MRSYIACSDNTDFPCFNRHTNSTLLFLIFREWAVRTFLQEIYFSSPIWILHYIIFTMHSIITLHDNMHVLYHSLHKGSKGSYGSFAVDYKKGARLAPQMVSKNFLLDKVKGPGI